MKKSRTPQPVAPAASSDHGARVLAHYLALALFLATLAVVAATPPEPKPEPTAATTAPEPEKEGFWSKAFSLVGKLL